MNPRELLNDDSAVSPVIGVILMVAITVILAAVIATFVLGLGDQMGTSTPTASFTSEYDTGANELTITMDNGQMLDPSNLMFRGDIDDTGEISDGEYWSDADTSPSEVTAGESIDIGVSSDEYEVRLIYEQGDTTTTLKTFEG